MSELYHFHVQSIFHLGPGLTDTLYSEASALRTLITESKSQTKNVIFADQDQNMYSRAVNLFKIHSQSLKLMIFNYGLSDPF